MKDDSPPENTVLTTAGLLRIYQNRSKSLVRTQQNVENEQLAVAPVVIASPDHRLRLGRMNKHPKDSRISFVEESHTYYLDGSVRFPLSVSAVWAKFFESFDPSKVIEKYFARWSAESTSKYFSLIIDERRSGKKDNEIKQSIASSWRHKGAAACIMGTHMHRQIELFLNARDFDDSMPELKQFLVFCKEFLHPRGWTPFRTEWAIYDESFMVAGQIDSIFKDETGRLHMIDWKRVEKDLCPDDGSCFGRHGTGPCSFLVDNQWSHYAAQLNLYATILSRNYGVAVTSMWLVQLHVNRSTFTAIEVPIFREMAQSMLEQGCTRGASTQVKEPVS